MFDVAHLCELLNKYWKKPNIFHCILFVSLFLQLYKQPYTQLIILLYKQIQMKYKTKLYKQFHHDILFVITIFY